ncbi:MAG: ribokinase [Micrococcales bacterium]|nr:ribokinase [Micrococcales bacterium]
MGRVIVVGSLNVDVVTGVERHPVPGETVLGHPGGRFAGGKGANQAMAARRAGAEVVMVAAVGADEDGAAYIGRLQDNGVGTRIVMLEEAPTGRALITVDAAEETTIIVVPGANALLPTPDLAQGPALTPADVVLLSLEIPLGTVIDTARQAHARGARVIVNLAPYAGLPPDVVELADPVVVNESEMTALADSDLLPGSLLVTFGASGAMWDGERIYGTAVPEDEVIDAVGAGDAFCGALTAALAGGACRAAALLAANEAGAAAVRWRGAQPDAAL